MNRRDSIKTAAAGVFAAVAKVSGVDLDDGYKLSAEDLDRAYQAMLDLTITGKCIVDGKEFYLDPRIPEEYRGSLNAFGAGNIIDTSWADPVVDIADQIKQLSESLQVDDHPLLGCWAPIRELQH